MLSPETRHENRGTHNRAFFVGDEHNEFYVELLGVHDEAAARAAGAARYVAAAAEGRGLSSVVLRVADLQETARELAVRGLNLSIEQVHAGGRLVASAATLGDAERATVDLRVIQYPERADARYRRHEDAGLFGHRFPLKRLDHLAAAAPELEAVERYWEDVLGIAVSGEVRGPAMLIRQLAIGDAVLELLGPATPESPIRQRRPGLASMCAFEVEDIEAAVRAARAAGFSPPDPSPGPLPGTRVATIPAAELAGLGLQLLQYV